MTMRSGSTGWNGNKVSKLDTRRIEGRSFYCALSLCIYLFGLMKYNKNDGIMANRK